MNKKSTFRSLEGEDLKGCKGMGAVLMLDHFIDYKNIEVASLIVVIVVFVIVYLFNYAKV